MICWARICRPTSCTLFFVFKLVGPHNPQVVFLLFCKPISCTLLVCVDFLWVYRPYEVSDFTWNAFEIMSENSLGPEICHICKTCFVAKSLWEITIDEKSATNFIGWCSHNTKRINFDSRYEHIMIL